MNISERVISGVFGRCRLVFYEKILRVCLFLVLDIKVVDHGLFFDHLRPGASTGSLAAVLFDVSDGRRGPRSRLALYQRCQG